MSDDSEDDKQSIITEQFVSETADEPAALKPLFAPEEIDIYVDKITLESYIFYGKLIDTSIKHFQYDHKACRIYVLMTDGRKADLGLRIPWLIRPYIKKTKEVAFVRTKDGEALEGLMVPVEHINQDGG